MKPSLNRSSLGELVQRELTGSVPDDVHARGREKLLVAALRDRSLPKRRSARPLLLLVAAALAAVGLWFVVPTLLQAPAPVTASTAALPARSPNLEPISFEAPADPAVARGDGFIDAGANETLLTFSDGSRVVFARGARGRVADRTSRGARIVLSSGVVDLDVVHRDATEWSVEAGPHVVRVTGTSFRVRFDPERGHFEVRMRDGRVIVAGPGAPEGLPVVRGQALVAERAGGYHIADAATLTEDVAASSLDAPGAPARPVPSASSPSSESSPSNESSADEPAKASWSAKVSRGEYKAVVDEANARGLESVASTAPLADLIALADAARYTKSPAVARRALEAQRARFADTTAGRTATFLLGRIAEDSDGSPARALELYDAYLATGGAFASEALGRKMMIVSRTKGAAAAAPIARAYLEAYPKGAYASIAGELGATP
ncbi:MAG: FecR domain-containing protein [Myxococcales bacterium]|nr:FecR domain-containing protein [Myxococcales bacterium]